MPYESRSNVSCRLQSSDITMRVLITGGAGFIGSHLAEAFLDDHHEVFVIDDLSTGSIDNIDRVRSHPHFGYLIDSISNEPVLAEHIDRSDVVCLLYTSPSPRD